MQISDQILEPASCQSEQPRQSEFYLKPEYINDAQMQFHHLTNEPVINIVFSESGNKKFIAVQKDRLGKSISLCFKGKLLSQPTLVEYVYGGTVLITGGFTVEEATGIAVALNQVEKSN